MDEGIYWVWLQHALGPGSIKVRKVLERFVSIRQLWEDGAEAWKEYGIFSPTELKAMEQFTMEQAYRLCEEQTDEGIWTLTPSDKEYPQKLAEIYDLPAVLFGKGKLPELNKHLSVALVGTRKATPEGLKLAFQLGRGLAQKGVVVVSGGAMGIDEAVHRGALSVGGKTLCVLGCGIGFPYLKSSSAMREQITKQGALLSEYPVGTPPTKWNFPIRNRLISGLSDGVVVIEADTRSGSLLTAHCALEQNRDVFAVPGSVHAKESRGVNALLKSGAQVCTEVNDILDSYTRKYPYLLNDIALPLRPAVVAVEQAKQTKSSEEIAQQAVLEEKPKNKPVSRPKQTKATKATKPEKESKKEPVKPPVVKSQQEEKSAATPMPSFLTGDAATLYQALTQDPLHLSDLEAKTGLSPQKLLPAVTQLELFGCVKSLSGSRYQLP